jgi:hypothetical protein
MENSCLTAGQKGSKADKARPNGQCFGALGRALLEQPKPANLPGLSESPLCCVATRRTTPGHTLLLLAQ